MTKAFPVSPGADCGKVAVRPQADLCLRRVSDRPPLAKARVNNVQKG